MIDDSKYWNEFYAQNKALSDASSFAKFVYDFCDMPYTSKLLELGLGNGRDAIYFSSKGLNVSGMCQHPHLSTAHK